MYLIFSAVVDVIQWKCIDFSRHMLRIDQHIVQ